MLFANKGTITLIPSKLIRLVEAPYSVLDREMFVTRAQLEKILSDGGYCRVEDFRSRTDWTENKYNDCYRAILEHYSIENDRRRTNLRSVFRFLKKGTQSGEIGPKKRKRAEVNTIESSEDEEETGSLDVSMTSVLSQSESPEVLELKRLLTEQNKELKGKDHVLLQKAILFQ